MKVAIFGQAFYPDSAKYLQQIIKVFRSRKIKFLFQKQYLELINSNQFLSNTENYKIFETIDESYDLFF